MRYSSFVHASNESHWRMHSCCPALCTQHLPASSDSCASPNRAKKLLSLQPPANPGDSAAWSATTMGRAVYESTLPIDMGIALYRRISELQERGLPLGLSMSEGHIPLTFLIIQARCTIR